MHLDSRRLSKHPQTVEVTLLFSDVVGSTELTERLGDLEAYHLIRHFCVAVQERALACGGEALELRGDGTLIAFSTPKDALVCAAAVQRSCSRDGRLAIRTGVHAGMALRVADGYFGRAVIAAVRIAECARPNEILVSSELVHRLDDCSGFPIGRTQSLRLKGFAEPLRVCSLDWWNDDERREHRPFRQDIPALLPRTWEALPDRASISAH
jgi:class 3 adenylate cyclase